MGPFGAPYLTCPVTADTPDAPLFVCEDVTVTVLPFCFPSHSVFLFPIKKIREVADVPRLHQVPLCYSHVSFRLLFVIPDAFPVSGWNSCGMMMMMMMDFFSIVCLFVFLQKHSGETPVVDLRCRGSIYFQFNKKNTVQGHQRVGSSLLPVM